MSPSSPIAIIDSTLGGLSVVKALRQILPKEEIVFLGDTARGGYGSKSLETLGHYTRQLLEQIRLFTPKHVAITCNSASSAVMPAIRREFPELSISSIVDAAARSAIDLAGARETPLMGIVASESTIRSKSYERAIHRRRHYARLLLRPTPLLDAIAEEGREDEDALLRLMLRQYLNPMADRGVNVLVLGSTWYSSLRLSVARLLPDGIRVVDSAESCAQDVARRLQAAGLLRGGQSTGALHCLLTDQTPRFDFHARRLLGEAVESPKVISLDDFYRPAVAQHAIRASA
ncbi:MAG TPA: aspartate/glutamate racemase family protein [Tepidisphaeraceae bacterium]|jgi:glutamate racemase